MGLQTWNDPGVLVEERPRTEAPARRQLDLRLLVLAVPALFAAARAASALRHVRGTPLQADATYFVYLAEHFGLHSLGASSREPVWPALLTIPVHASGSNPDSLRMLGLITFPLLVVAVQLLVRDLLDDRWAWACALLVASSWWLVAQSVEGLREVAAAALVLLFLRAAGRTGRASAWRYGAFGVAAALLALLRWDTLLVTLPVLAFVLLRERPPLRHVAVAVACLVLLVSPLCVGNAIENGDPMYHSNIHASFFRNQQFEGQPGYITAEERRVAAYAGPSTTWAHYLLVDNDPADTLRRIPHGGVTIGLTVVRIGYSSVDDLVPWLVLLLALVGLVRLTVERRLVVPIAAVVALWQFSPIVQLIDLRLALTSLPMLLILATCGVAYLVDVIAPDTPERPATGSRPGDGAS